MSERVTCIDIEVAIANLYGVRRNIIVPNVSWGMFNHECDLIIISGSGYATEVEIKVSKSDLKKDFEKRHGHNDSRIKNLYYAIPENLLPTALELVPESAGIIVYENDKCHCKLHRRAVSRNSSPLSKDEISQIARLGTMRIFALKASIINLRNQLHDLKQLNKSQ